MYHMCIRNYKGEVIYRMDVNAESFNEASEILWDNFIQDTYIDEEEI